MDVSREDIDKLTSAIQGMSGTLGRASANTDSEREKAKNSLLGTLGAYAKNASTNSRNFESSVFKTEDALKRLTGSLDSSIDSMRRMLGGVFGGAIVGLVLQKGSQMAKTFSDMNEIGQNFGGSMLKMHKAAAEAGLPLSDFADLVKKNGEVMAKMGTQEFANLAHNIRNVIQKQGMYGYSIEQINDQLGEYAKTSALYGTANLLSTKNSSGAMIELAVNTSILSDVTKKSREEITKLANEAMRTALVLGGMDSIPLDMKEATHKTMANVMAVFAAQQGEGAQMMTKLLGDTFGSGFSGLSEIGKSINSAGLGGLLSDMDELAQKVKNNSATQEDAMNFTNKFKQSVEDNAVSLTQLATSGNAQAAQMLTAAHQMKIFNAQDMERAKKDVKVREGLTNLFGGFNNALANIISKIQFGFINGITPFLKGLSGLADSAGGWDYFQKTAQRFGAWLGNFLTTTLTEQNTKKFTDIMESVFNVGKSLITTLGSIGEILIKISPALAVMGGWIIDTVSDMETFGEAIGSVVDSMLGSGHKFQKGIGGLVAVLTVMFGPKIIKGIISTFAKNVFMSKTMDKTIMARNVTVIGPGGRGGGMGGGGGDFGGGGGGGNGKKGMRLGKRLRVARARMGGHFSRNRGRYGGLISAGLAAGMLFGATSAMASTGENSDDDDENPSSAKAAPMKVMRAEMIKDAKQREVYNKLMKQKLDLQRLPLTDENQSKLDALNKQISPFSEKYGLTVSDPHDYDYASLHGKLPPGSKYKGISAPQGQSNPSAAKAAGGQAGGPSMLDYASLGLGAASFVPGLGMVTGGLGAGVDLLRGDYLGAALSAGSMIPVAGDLAAAGKMAHMASLAGKVGTASRIGENVRGFGGMGLDLAGAAMPSMTGLGAALPSMGLMAGLAFPPLMGLGVGGAMSSLFGSGTDNTANIGASSGDLMNKMMSQNEDQNKMIISLLAQLTKLQSENTKMLTRVVTTRS